MPKPYFGHPNNLLDGQEIFRCPRLFLDVQAFWMSVFFWDVQKNKNVNFVFESRLFADAAITMAVPEDFAAAPESAVVQSAEEHAAARAITLQRRHGLGTVFLPRWSSRAVPPSSVSFCSAPLTAAVAASPQAFITSVHVDVASGGTASMARSRRRTKVASSLKDAC